MQLTTTCPNDATLSDFLRGALPDEVAMRLAFHLGGCRGCAGRADELRVSDPLLGAVRNPPEPLSAADRDRVAGLLEFRPPHTAETPAAHGRTITLGDASTTTVRPAAPPSTPPPSHWLGPYRLVKVLGSGGMGTVYEAVDTQLERRVAVKVMNPSVARSPIARQRFLREARAAAAVRTPHVVQVYQTGEWRESLYMSMELLDGETLQDRCAREGTLPVGEAVRIAREAAVGLAAAHDKGLIHRDIKPANIWLESPTGRVKVLDFGLVRPVDAADLRLTPDGVGVGTPGYVAPEQVKGVAVDARADLFSLGCVLYRMVTGKSPFNGATILEILTALAVETPARPRHLNPKVPADLDALITRLMAKRPEQRPASAAVVAAELEAVERKMERKSDRFTPPAVPLVPLQTADADAAPPAGRPGWLRAAVAAAAVFGAAAAGMAAAWYG